MLNHPNIAAIYGLEQADGKPFLSQSPTMANTGTIARVILGTAAYMSPEQARGKPVDKRADVWSFAVLLWEMLTGRQLFGGDTVTDVIAAVMTREPDLDALRKATPEAVRKLIARCLRRDLRTRLPDIGAASPREPWPPGPRARLGRGRPGDGRARRDALLAAPERADPGGRRSRCWPPRA